jgi:hypothetical protein
MLLAVTVVAVSVPATAGQEGVPIPSPAKAYKGEKCVEPADVMRREHMVFLKHQRDETMRQGIRGNKYSFNACVDCHATADPKIAEGKIRTLQPFCSGCHEYAAVNPDCFACHNPTAPLDKSSAATNIPLQKMIAAHLKDAGGDQ